MLWLVSSLINLTALTSLFISIYRKEKYLNVAGVAHMMIFSVILGPAFTMLIALYIYTEYFYDSSR